MIKNKLISIGEAFTTITGNTPPKSNKSFYGDFMPFIKPPELLDCKLNFSEDNLSKEGSKVARIAPKDAILVSCIGNLGKVGKATRPVAFNQQINAIVPNNEKSLPQFMFYQVISTQFRNQLEALASGTTVPIVNKTKFNSIKIFLPPLPEQRRIVAILDEAFAGLETMRVNAKKNIQNLIELLSNYKNSIFITGDGWQIFPLEQVSTIINGYAFKSADFTKKSGVKCVKITNVGVGIFVDEFDDYLPEKIKSQYVSFTIKTGDIIMALTRTIISDGVKVALVPSNADGALLNQRVASIRVKDKIIDNTFLFSYLTSNNVFDYVRKNVNTLMQPNLSINDLRAMPIPFPHYDKQLQVSDNLKSLQNELDKVLTIYSKKVELVEELKQSILHKAFTGELTSSDIAA